MGLAGAGSIGGSDEAHSGCGRRGGGRLICGAGQAFAADTQTLCSTGAGKAVVAPGASGRCASGQTSMVLATGTAVSALKTKVTSLQSQVSALRSTLSGVTRSGKTLRFTGLNLQVLSGSGSTSGAVNGLGNVIIGYNEVPGTQTGSHNLVLGDNQAFTSYGGIIGGQNNRLNGAYAAVLGFNNSAGGNYSSVAGGNLNSATGNFASVNGGYANIAGGTYSSVGGGEPEPRQRHLRGGRRRVQQPRRSGNPGGRILRLGRRNHQRRIQQRRRRGAFASVSGGRVNLASGDFASVSGGEGNLASDPYASITAGCNNLAGPGTQPGHTCFGSGLESITGGRLNQANGHYSTVSGGWHNTASAGYSSVSGGGYNTASDPSALGNKFSWIGGGFNNTADGNYAAILGGTSNEVGTSCGTFPGTGQSC